MSAVDKRKNRVCYLALWMSIGVILGFLFYNIFLQNRYTIADINIPTSEILQEKSRLLFQRKQQQILNVAFVKIVTELNKKRVSHSRVSQLNCVKSLLRYALTPVGGRDF